MVQCNFQCRGIVGRGPVVLAAGAVIVQAGLIFLSLSPFSGRRFNIDYKTVSKAVKPRTTSISNQNNP